MNILKNSSYRLILVVALPIILFCFTWSVVTRYDTGTLYSSALVTILLTGKVVQKRIETKEWPGEDVTKNR